MCNVIASFQSISQASAQLSHQKHKSRQTPPTVSTPSHPRLLVFASAGFSCYLGTVWKKKKKRELMSNWVTEFKQHGSLLVDRGSSCFYWQFLPHALPDESFLCRPVSFFSFDWCSLTLQESDEGYQFSSCQSLSLFRPTARGVIIDASV